MKSSRESGRGLSRNHNGTICHLGLNLNRAHDKPYSHGCGATNHQCDAKDWIICIALSRRRLSKNGMDKITCCISAFSHVLAHSRGSSSSYNLFSATPHPPPSWVTTITSYSASAGMLLMMTLRKHTRKWCAFIKFSLAHDPDLISPNHRH